MWGDGAPFAALQDVYKRQVVNGVSGFAGLFPLLSALRAGKTVALANKESIVCGHVVVNLSLIHIFTLRLTAQGLTAIPSSCPHGMLKFPPYSPRMRTALPLFSPQAVSYTHLDVYKRQYYIFAYDANGVASEPAIASITGR